MARSSRPPPPPRHEAKRHKIADKDRLERALAGLVEHDEDRAFIADSAARLLPKERAQRGAVRIAHGAGDLLDRVLRGAELMEGRGSSGDAQPATRALEPIYGTTAA